MCVVTMRYGAGHYGAVMCRNGRPDPAAATSPETATMMKRFASTLLLACTVAAPAHGGILGWFTNLEGGKVVPPQVTQYNGIGFFGLKGAELTCSLYCTVNYGTARIHAGAPGTNGPVLGTIPVSTVGSWTGKIVLDAAGLAALEAGHVYAEITGLLVPDKVRGQLTPSYETYGTGCPDSAGVPSFSGTGVARVGYSIYLQASKGLPGGVGLLFLSVVPADLSLPGGCSFLVSPVNPLVLPISFTATGAWSSGAVTVPASAPIEIPIHFQLLVPDPGAPNGMYGASARLTMNVFAY